MPKTLVVYFKDNAGKIPAIEFIESISPLAREKLQNRLERLEEMGHELRRPEADYLRGGIHELRMRTGHTNFRLLYFFHGNTIAVVASGLTKEDRVPPVEIDRAIARKLEFERDPAKHSHIRRAGMNP